MNGGEKMSGLSGWAAAISICAVICTIVELMVSDSKLEKTVRFVLGAFMLCAILMPIGDMVAEISDIDFSQTMTESTDEKFNEQKKKLMENQISSLVSNTLAEKNIYPQKTEVSMDIDESSGISMVSVTVILKKEDAEKANTVTDTIKTQLGLECNTVFAD